MTQDRHGKQQGEDAKRGRPQTTLYDDIRNTPGKKEGNRYFTRAKNKYPEK